MQTMEESETGNLPVAPHNQHLFSGNTQNFNPLHPELEQNPVQIFLAARKAVHTVDDNPLDQMPIDIDEKLSAPCIDLDSFFDLSSQMILEKLEAFLTLLRQRAFERSLILRF